VDTVKQRMDVQTGLERFLIAPPRELIEARFGLLCNPASVDRRLRHARNLIEDKLPGRLRALYSPQHGFYAEKQDNMAESDHIRDPVLGLPVFSLYGKMRSPTADMLDPIDVLLIDLQDVGTRVYTFITTVSYCMEAARRFGKKIVVLDRPNPIGGDRLEGNCLSPACASFVGRFPIPMRHGLTIGELALLFNDRFGLGCELEVIRMSGWDRRMYFDDTGLPWVCPSPNLPTLASVVVYPGQVLLEGTNLSEGRGTTQPFEVFGAPYIDVQKVLQAMESDSLSGMVLRETAFEPTSNKWEGRLCKGFQIHVTDREMYRPYRTSLALLRAVRMNHADRFAWKPPPYEYEYERLPIDLICGDPDIRERIETCTPIDEIEASWKKDLEAFADMSRAYHLY